MGSSVIQGDDDFYVICDADIPRRSGDCGDDDHIHHGAQLSINIAPGLLAQVVVPWWVD
jgi:hypothetical protein